MEIRAIGDKKSCRYVVRGLSTTNDLIFLLQADIDLACTKPYYLDVAEDSRVCYVEKDFLSKVICKKLHDEVHCLHYNVSK